MFCKGALITGEGNIFFDRYSSVPFAPRSLVSANPSEKFYLSFFLQEGSCFWEHKKTSWNTEYLLQKIKSAVEKEVFLQK